MVLLSYVVGLKAGKSADILWGGTPKKIRCVYTVSMLISALSFLITTIYILTDEKYKYSITILNEYKYILYTLCNTVNMFSHMDTLN